MGAPVYQHYQPTVALNTRHPLVLKKPGLPASACMQWVSKGK